MSSPCNWQFKLKMHEERKNFDNFKSEAGILHPFAPLKTQECYYCRVCRDYNSKENQLIRSCRCSDHVHEKYLKACLSSQDAGKLRRKCETCKTKYKLEDVKLRQCSITEWLDDGFMQLIYLPRIFYSCLLLSLSAILELSAYWL